MKHLLFIFALTLSLFSTALSAETTSASKNQTQGSAEVTVNINTADAKTLASSLDGIGNVKAQAIVDFRGAHGPFASAQDLGDVQGVGPATIASNQSVIVVK